MTAPVTRFDAERAVHLSIGAMSPLWPAYFVAASSSMAMWWLSRWTSPLVATTPTPTAAPKATPVAVLPPPIELNAVVEVPTISDAPKTVAKAVSKPSAKPAATVKATTKAAVVAKPAPKAKAATTKSVASAPRTSTKRPASKV